jgi:uncharacterized membrane protein (UPF0127 family)
VRELVFGSRVVGLGGRELDLLVADRPSLWAAGLAGKEDTAPGMLFEFPVDSRIPFSMEHVERSLLLALFDRDGDPVDVAYMAAKGGHVPRNTFRYAVELFTEHPIRWLPDIAQGLRLVP